MSLNSNIKQEKTTWRNDDSKLFGGPSTKTWFKKVSKIAGDQICSLQDTFCRVPCKKSCQPILPRCVIVS